MTDLTRMERTDTGVHLTLTKPLLRPFTVQEETATPATILATAEPETRDDRKGSTVRTTVKAVRVATWDGSSP